MDVVYTRSANLTYSHFFLPPLQKLYLVKKSIKQALAHSPTLLQNPPLHYLKSFRVSEMESS